MFEKRRRRRESHNAVERRRRDNINERIHGKQCSFLFNRTCTHDYIIELCTLLPERLLDSAPTSSNVMSVSSGQVGANGRAINKGTILKLSVDHIKELREDVSRYQERIRELEHMIESAKRGGLVLDSIKSQQQQYEDNKMYTHNNNNNNNVPKGHQRVGSIQFSQQFNNLQLGGGTHNDL
jgi:hypothetical protein